MKLHFLAIAFFLVSSAAYGQILFPEKQTICEAKTFILENEKILAGYESDEAMIFDFLKKMDTRNIKKMKGELFVQILVDSLGRSCCLSFENKTDVQTKRLGVVNAIQYMNGWSIIKDSGQPISVVLKFIFTKRKFVVVRLGYNAKSKFSTLSSVEVKRSAVKD
jgi:hypothetical protein